MITHIFRGVSVIDVFFNALKERAVHLSVGSFHVYQREKCAATDEAVT